MLCANGFIQSFTPPPSPPYLLPLLPLTQAVCAAACFPDAFPLLVVCPSSMRYVWKVRCWVSSVPNGADDGPLFLLVT